jgi:proton glutamate symport protein
VAIGWPSETGWVVIAMAVGIATGWLFPDAPGATGFHATSLQVVSSIFLRLIKSLIAPLLFGTLVVGIAGHGDDMKGIGRLAVRSIIYFEVVTTLALVVGLVMVNVVEPGVGVSLASSAAAVTVDAAVAKPTLATLLEHMVPNSIVDAAARNDALQITFFSIVFAVAVSRAPVAARTTILSFCESLTEVMFRFVGFVMKVAPLGIGCAIAATVSRSGVGVLRNLGALVLTLYGSLGVFALVVLLPVALAFRVPVRRFWRAIREPGLVAFSTASSEAALPLALRNVEQLGVPRRVVSFVLPAGYTFNMDGTTLYLALASVFVAQAGGIHLSLAQQIPMMMTLLVTSKGLAGVPRSSLVVLSAMAAQFGLPLSGIALILGVDAVMDMARTAINLVGNCLAAVVLSRWDGSFRLSPEGAPVHEARPPVRVALAELYTSDARSVSR